MEDRNTIYQRLWYRANKDKINAKRRTKVMCPTCQQLFNKSSLKKHQQGEGIFGSVWKNNIKMAGCVPSPHLS